MGEVMEAVEQGLCVYIEIRRGGGGGGGGRIDWMYCAIIT